MKDNSPSAILDTTDVDFSGETGSGDEQPVRRIGVRNDQTDSVLQVTAISPVPWIEIFPSEFALAPGAAQSVGVLLRPELANNQVLSKVALTFSSQLISTGSALPRSSTQTIRVIPPLNVCPHCRKFLDEGVRECRNCGERIRLCPVCGAPNTWIARVCRVSESHIIRTESDWLASPGGTGTHDGGGPATRSVHLARRWAWPGFAVTRPADTAEWCAPLAAFGMALASSIVSGAARATIHAFDIASGAPLWEYDLPDSRGIYPDRGAMCLSEDGVLYAATLGGTVVALDAIRGTRLWSADAAGSVYGGVTVDGDLLCVPAGDRIVVYDRHRGEALRSIATAGRIDTSPAVFEGSLFVTCDDGAVYAFDPETGALRWKRETGAAFDASPVVRGGIVFAANLGGVVLGLDAGNGEARWRTQASDGPIAVTPALSADGLLYVGADDGFLHVIAAETGKMVRSKRISGAAIRTSPVCVGRNVFVGADDGSVYVVDSQFNVNRCYETTAGARLGTASPAVYGGALVYAATNGVLYCLEATE